MAAAERTPLDPGAGVLVMVTLYGGNDGLNTVVPAAIPPTPRPGRAGVPARGGARPRRGSRAEPGHDRAAQALGQAERAGVLRGVGYPKPDRSHFRSMAIWQTASPTTAATTGWLGRWLDATTTDPLLAVSLDTLIPPMLAGATVAGASLPVAGLKVPKTALGPFVGPARTPGQRRRALAGPRREVDRRPRCGAEDARAGRREEPRRGPARERRERPGRLGRRAERARPAAGPGRHADRAGRPDPGLLGLPGRLRHPLRRTRHPAAAADRAGHGAHHVPDPPGWPPIVAGRS